MPRQVAPRGGLSQLAMSAKLRLINMVLRNLPQFEIFVS
jgi:hypothetical protein